MKHDRWGSSSDEEEEQKSPSAETQPIVKKLRRDDATPTFPKHNPLTSGCRSVYDCYERLARLDEGTYGVVWKAKDLGMFGCSCDLDGVQTNVRSH